MRTATGEAGAVGQYVNSISRLADRVLIEANMDENNFQRCVRLIGELAEQMAETIPDVDVAEIGGKVRESFENACRESAAKHRKKGKS